MDPALSRPLNNKPYNDLAAPSNRTDYQEPIEAATVETVLLKLSNNQLDSCHPSAEEQAAAKHLVQALSALRQYNHLLNRDGRRDGLHGCLSVAGHAFYDSAGKARVLPSDFQPLQWALSDAYAAAGSGVLNPEPVDLQLAIDRAHRLLEKFFGIDRSNPCGN